MNEEFNSTPISVTGEELTWYQAWVTALTRPDPLAYEKIISDPGATSTKAYIWIFISSLVTSVMSVGIIVQTPDFRQLFQDSGIVFETRNLVGLICILPFSALVGVLFFLLGVAFTHWVAGLLGGKGQFSSLLYATAAFSAPLSIVTGFIGLVPILNCLTPILSIYGLVLFVIAIKAVNNLDWVRATIAGISLPLIFGIIIACFIALIISLLIPVFSQSIQSSLLWLAV